MHMTHPQPKLPTLRFLDVGDALLLGRLTLRSAFITSCAVWRHQHGAVHSAWTEVAYPCQSLEVWNLMSIITHPLVLADLPQELVGPDLPRRMLLHILVTRDLIAAIQALHTRCVSATTQSHILNVYNPLQQVLLRHFLLPSTTACETACVHKTAQITPKYLDTPKHLNTPL